jgi:hypothetical protein
MSFAHAGRDDDAPNLAKTNRTIVKRGITGAHRGVKDLNRDPEEYYGLVTADRHPRPAFRLVSELFAEDQDERERVIPPGVIVVLVISAAPAWSYARSSVGKAR